MKNVKDPFWAAVESFGLDKVFVLPDWVKDRITDAPGEPPDDVSGKMKALMESVQDCMKCELGKTRNNIVFGEGNPEAGILVIGEGPGATEDETGRPFTGRSGKLLDKILASIQLDRNSLYIANIVKCRPPMNRTPSGAEAEICGKYLSQQIRIMKPEVILALGASAARYLLDTKSGLGALRGDFHRYMEIPVLVTYHPAALLRSPALKRPVWEDMKKLRDFLDRAGLPRDGGGS